MDLAAACPAARGGLRWGRGTERRPEVDGRGGEYVATTAVESAARQGNGMEAEHVRSGDEALE